MPPIAKHLSTCLLRTALLLALAAPDRALAQRPQDPSSFWHSADTAIVQTIGTAVFQQLGWALSRAALDPTPWPWTIGIPDDAADPWLRLRTHLQRSLNARPREASDTIGSILYVESVRVHGDSLTAQFTVGATWRCRDGGGGGTTTGYEVRAWRYQGRWQPPRTEAVLHGDSMPCPRP